MYLLYFKLIYRIFFYLFKEKVYLFTLNNISTFIIDLYIHSTMSIYLYLIMFILAIINSTTFLIKTIQTKSIMFNQLCIIVSKHKSTIKKSSTSTA